MGQREATRFVQCGREVSSQELEELQETVELFRALSRWELAHTICEHWGWVTASGAHKVDACLKLLESLEVRGLIRLPAKQAQGPKQSKPLAWTERTNAGSQITAPLADLAPVWLEVVLGRERTGVWNEYVDRYHYLGYKRPFGCFLRYFVVCGRGLLGCMLFSGAAKSIRVRDQWIGWTEKQRLKNLPWVVNNSRFLVFPWVRVKNLASHVLGQLARGISQDWYERWGYRPVLLETFVDSARYEGTCYQAAGWITLGRTTGRGLPRQGCRYTTTPKLIYVRPLVDDFRFQLCSEGLTGRVEQ